MTNHIFAVGQRVSLNRQTGFPSQTADIFVVKALLPPLGGEAFGTKNQYRIKSERENYERVVVEHLLFSARP